MLDETDQSAVIVGLRAGSQQAWARLYDSYHLDVWRYTARLLGTNAAAVADVVQETFLEAAGSASRFDPQRGSLWSWLTGIAHHRVAAHWRQASRATQVMENVARDHAHDARADSQLDPQAHVESVEMVRRTLAELPAEYALLLTTKYLDQRSLVEMAVELGSTSEAVKSKLARARREFRAAYDALAEPGAVAPRPNAQTKR